MRKVLVGGVAAIALLAAGGYGLWRVGLGEVEAALDARLAALKADGVDIAYDAREIAGFPTGYAVTLRTVTARTADGAVELRAPWVRTEAAFPNPTVARTTLAPEAALTVTPPAETGAAPVGLALITEDFGVESPLGGGAQTLTAASLSLRAVEGWPGGFLEATLSDLTAGIAAPEPGAAGFEMAAARMAAAFDAPDGQGRVLRNETSSEGFTLTLSGRGLGGEGLSDFLAADGRFDLRIGAASGASRNAALGAESGPVSALVTASPAGLVYATTATDLRYDLLEAPRGKATVGALTFGFEAPLSPNPEPQPYRVHVALDAAALDPALWAALDPQATLARGPFALTADIGGALRLTAPLDADALDGAPPARVETIDIRRLALSGLGAEAAASGALKLIEGQEAPDGALTLRIAGWPPVLEALAAMGVIGPDQAALATLMAQEYGKPDSAPGVFDADIEMLGGVATVNGRALQ